MVVVLFLPSHDTHPYLGAIILQEHVHGHRFRNYIPFKLLTKA